ncbi:MAG TPA: hypothetical protein VMX55_13775 [candidate division Zixibacteria bacterium]|nr:hypothetical protein [candidate division Zixibacteria bacterium]
MSDVEKIISDDELDPEKERLVYRITEGLQRLNSIGTVQFIQIDLPPIRDSIKEELTGLFDSALGDGLYVNQTIVLEQMDTGDSFMRALNTITKLFKSIEYISIDEIQAVVNLPYKGETMDIIVTYDPEEHDISLVSVSQHEEFFKILEYVRFFWMKSRPRI